MKARARRREVPLIGGGFLAFFLLAGCQVAPAPPPRPELRESAWLKRVRQVMARVPEILAKNHKTFEGPGGPVSGFGAGETYPQIWLRDSSWIVEAAAASYPPETLTSWLDLHLASADRTGRLRDWVARGKADAFRQWAPRVEERAGLAFDTNTNESDQEPGAALAVCRVERLLGPRTDADRAERSARVSRAIAAMEALLRDRTDKPSGLVWSGLTADWGDVSPLYPDQRAIYRDARTPRTLSLYTNVMVFAALDCLGALDGPQAVRDRLMTRARQIRDRLRTSFWREEQGFFRIRLSLDAEPPGFQDDEKRFALGGNALAVLFGVADDAQAAAILTAAERLRVTQGFSTLSTTLVPPYAAGVFQHPAMRAPFQYQNGGQWDWFGALLVEAEFERGFSVRARIHLDQIVSRILRAGPGLSEWYDRDGQPQGSPAYAASAAAIHRAGVRGLLGLSRTDGGSRIVLRSGETLLPFVVRERATATSLTVSQVVTDSAIEMRVEGTGRFPVIEVCSVLPPGARAASLAAPDSPMPQGVRQRGEDTLLCADTSRSPLPIGIRFSIER